MLLRLTEVQCGWFYRTILWTFLTFCIRVLVSMFGDDRLIIGLIEFAVANERCEVQSIATLQFVRPVKMKL